MGQEENHSKWKGLHGYSHESRYEVSMFACGRERERETVFKLRSTEQDGEFLNSVLRSLHITSGKVSDIRDFPTFC